MKAARETSPAAHPKETERSGDRRRNEVSEAEEKIGWRAERKGSH